MDSIEGVDYLVDRYAVLGVARDATHEEIASAVKEQRAQYHPDRLIKAGPDVLVAAERARERINLAAEILMNKEARPLYDARLAEFEDKHPHLVSKNGTPIIDLERQRLNLDYLLQDEILDTSDLEKQAATMIGFDQKRLDRARKYYALDPTDPDADDALRQELTAQYGMLTLMEDFAWMRAGMHGWTDEGGLMRDAEAYVDRIEAEIAKTSLTIIPAAVATRQNAVLIGVAPPPLLLAGPNGSSAASDAPTTDLVVAEAKRRFELRAADIREIAARKQAALLELLDHSKTVVLAESECPIYDLFLVKGEGEEATAMIAFRLEATNADLTGIVDFESVTLTDLKSQSFEGTAIAVMYNAELGEPIVQIRRLAETILRKLADKPAVS